MRRFVFVQKALKGNRKGRGNPSSNEYVGVHDAADSTVPTVHANIINDVKRFANGIDREVIEDLINRGALDQLDSKIPWAELEQAMQQGLGEETIRSFIKTLDKTNNFTRRVIEQALGLSPDLTFDSNNPRVARWIEDNTAKCVRDIVDESRKNIQEVVRVSQVKELNTNEVFRTIKRNIGLTKKHIVAQENLRSTLEAKGVAKGKINTQLESMAKKQLGQRAETIARTETMRAANAGQQEGWEQAAEEGLFDRDTATVRWVVTPDDRLCPTCRPMQGVERPLNETWTVKIRTEKGRVTGQVEVKIPNAVHPNCRCVAQLVLDGET